MFGFPRHSAGIFETVEEKALLLRNFFLQAKNANRRIGLFIHDVDQDTLLSQISDATLDLRQGIKDGWFCCMPAQQAYLPTGHFDIQEMYQRLEHCTQSAIDEGYSGLSVSGIMSWAREEGIKPEVMAEYEYGIAKIFERRPELHALCLYSKSHFDLQDISVQCNCHPHVVTPTECTENPIGRIQADHGFPHLVKKQDFIKFWNLLSKWGTPLQSLRGSSAKSVMNIFSDTRLALLKTLDDEKNHSNPEIFKLIALLDDKLEQLELCSALREFR